MECEKKEEALQREIDRYRSEKTKLETEKKMKQDRMVCRQEVSLLLYLFTVLRVVYVVLILLSASRNHELC